MKVYSTFFLLFLKMVWKERIDTFKYLKYCYSCGETDRKNLNTDHRLPQALIYIPKIDYSIEERNQLIKKHPMTKVVRDPSNLYKICFNEHHNADSEKLERFLEYWKINQFEATIDCLSLTTNLDSMERGDPEALVKWLHRKFKWSRDPYDFEIQRQMTWRSNMLFMQAVQSLKGYYTQETYEKYRRAASLAQQFNIEDKLRPSPSIVSYFDLSVSSSAIKAA